MKTCLIRQPAGLGDILFCQKIAHTYIDMGYTVIWPVISEFSCIGEYIKGPQFPTVDQEFIGKSYYKEYKIIKTDDLIFIPLQDADRYYSGPIMNSKYLLADINFNDWQNYLKINRNPDKENKLLAEIGIDKNEPFIFTNTYYGSPPGYKEIQSVPDFPIKTIKLQFLSGYSLFDWIGILKLAKEIHSVDTVLSYIIEVLPEIKCPLYLYSRYTPKHFNQTRHLYKRNWIYETDKI